jgi:hypothetical protein
MTQETTRAGRFGDAGRGQGIGAGLAGSTALPDTFTKKDIRRNLKEFKQFGVPQKIGKFRKKTDTQIENIAATAIVKRGIKRGDIKRRKLRTKFNRTKFSGKEIKRARRVMNAESPSIKALKQTREARRHIKTVRRNRLVMKTRLYPKNR